MSLEARIAKRLKEEGLNSSPFVKLTREKAPLSPPMNKQDVEQRASAEDEEEDFDSISDKKQRQSYLYLLKGAVALLLFISGAGVVLQLLVDGVDDVEPELLPPPSMKAASLIVHSPPHPQPPPPLSTLIDIGGLAEPPPSPSPPPPVPRPPPSPPSPPPPPSPLPPKPPCRAPPLPPHPSPPPPSPRPPVAPPPFPPAPPASPLPPTPPPPPPPKPPHPPYPPGQAVVNALNARYVISPYGKWPSDGSLPAAGLLVHCFDGVEGKQERWRPAIALKTSHDHPSTSMIFAEQTINIEGRPAMGPGKELFGHACASGGVILRPGSNHKVMCAHARDHGAYCGSFCPSPGGKLCSDAWRPEDIGEYLRLQTLSYRSSPEYGYYNEFLIDGLVWDRNLPHSIEGFLTSKGDGMVSSRAHADFSRNTV